MNTHNNLQGKVASVTGASRGIGEAIFIIVQPRSDWILHYGRSFERAKASELDEIRQAI